MKKRVLSFLLAYVFILTCTVQPVFAEEIDSAEIELNDTQAEENLDNLLEDELNLVDENKQDSVNDYEMTDEISAFNLEQEVPNATAHVKGDGYFEVKITGISQEADIKEVCVPTWNQDDQSDMFWYIAEKQEDGSYLVDGHISNHEYHLGDYEIHIYIRNMDDSLNFITKTSVNIGNVSAGNLYEDIAGNKYSKRLVLDSVEDQGLASKVYFVVWSEKNDQDDVVWYEATADGNTYFVDVPLVNHKDTGLYNVHVYISGKDWKMHLLKKTTLEITELPDSEINLKAKDERQGTFDVELYVNQQSNTFSDVYLAVWSQSDQSDLHWYNAELGADGLYNAHVDVKNHAYHTGKYNLHCYVRDLTGKLVFVDSIMHEVTLGAGNLTETRDSRGYSTKLTLSDAKLQGLASTVYFVVWSEDGDQDDVVWYEADKKDDTYSANVNFYNHNDIGTYNVHVYISGKDWKMHFLQKTTFEVTELPQPEVKVVGINEDKGTLEVESSIDRPSDRVKEVYFAVWSQSDQSDLYWYNAQLQEDGLYSAEVNVKNHAYHIGKYNIHCYIRDLNGKLVFIDAETHTVELKAGELTEIKDSEGYYTNLVLSDVKDQGIASKVYFVVWSQVNGQDDAVWYEAVKNGNSYSTDVVFSNHKDAGTYNVHVYISGKDWQMHKLATSTFEVEKLPDEGVSITNVDMDNGMFNLYIYLLQSSDIQTVRVPVWTRADQSDIYWYNAQKQADGRYKVTVDMVNHQWNSGLYIVHAYAMDKQGQMKLIDTTSVEMQLDTGVRIETVDEYSTKLTVYGVSNNAVNVRFPSWSIEDGQDDIFWYNGQKNSDGSWSVIVHSKNHKVAGDYLSHIYVDTSDSSTCIEQVSFEIADKSKARWEWIDGYKRYINEDGEIDKDVSRLVTGPYLIKVYKRSNYLIVFAKDENGQFNVPVKAMITSCGNATPTGTFYTPQKWRWQTMFGGSQAQWVTQITGDFLFHSVPYRQRNNTTLNVTNMYNHLGETRSAGCVRLEAGSAKWLYDNCELRTKVIITTQENAGPIEKPSFTPVPSWHTWDPTDPTAQYLCQKHGCH